MAISVDNIEIFINSVIGELMTGQTTEHSYRPFFKPLFESVGDIVATNDPKRSEHGAPDYIFTDKKNSKIIRGYAEMKDIDEDLDKTEKTEQINRYKGYPSVILTNNLDWRFFKNGDKYFEIKIGKYDCGNKKISELYEKHYNRLVDEIVAFFQLPPESITNGKRLAEIMGGKARRIRDNINIIFEKHSDPEIEKIYDMMKKLLMTDLTEEQFADMYAQTLVYGLFVARYSDDTPDNFTRAEARDLVPATNPFLREFFDHIAGASFNKSLSYIVDELCEIFAVSDIKTIVHKHLKLGKGSDDEKDPIIHFYEDFLANYDAELRKKMGAYYTPTPVVRYIVRMVDKVLKEDFSFSDGIASNDKIKYTHKVDPYQSGKTTRSKVLYERTENIPAVQILDPAVGTATFLNESIKYIYEQKFKNQKGLWNSYVNENILPRFNGFELMMTPYTIAHLKLGMTLQELGAKELKSRLRVFLTNTLTEGIENDLPLFALLGLTKVVAEESNLAAEVKNDLPVMVVMGNPPYSVSSNNKSKFIQELIVDYKKDLGERKINLDDDYIKFIRFSENMIEKNGKGIVAMITNNSYIDGITHRKMREHLLKTFDKIYILDLHGNSKKKEVSPDGSPDQNVFDIQQGVSIIVAMRSKKHSETLGKVYHSELYGNRKVKFDALNNDKPKYKLVKYSAPNYFFVPKDEGLTHEYMSGVSVNDLFVNKSSGFRCGAADSQICFNREDIIGVVEDLINLSETQYREKYKLKDGRNHYYRGMKNDVGDCVDDDRVIQTAWHSLFDIRWTYYSQISSGFAAWPRSQTMNNLVGHKNVGLIYMRGHIEPKGAAAGVTQYVSNERTFSRPGMSSADSVAPLYVYHPDNTKTPNFNLSELKKLTTNIDDQTPEDIFDYIYAVLHSPSYREKYKEFLKIDFPRVPIPTEKEFKRLAPLGRRLCELHLMHEVPKSKVTFPIDGDNIIEKVNYENKKVYINRTQYFDNVSELAWNFFIGGYQPAQKWLKDRKGRTLNFDDIIHYEKIVAILEETNKIMKQIG